METRYLLPAAVNLETRQTVKTQDLKGVRYTLRQRSLAQQEADRIAQRMTNQTDSQWVGTLIEYTSSDMGVRRF
jgi:hypothetical protein